MRSLKKLAHRNWESLRDLWVDHLPDIDFSADFPAPTLWDLPGLTEQFTNASINAQVPYIEGVRESAFREAVLLSRKFSYCRSVCVDAVTRGFPTWSIIASYDACFYGAKAFCYLLGIVSLGRHSKVFIDLFVPRMQKGRGRQEPAYDVLVAHRLDDYLTHNTLWSLTGRLCRTISLPASAQTLSDSLHSLNLERLSNFRNNVIYHGGFWLNADAPDHCDLTRVLSNVDLFRAIERTPDDPGESKRYFVVASKLNDALVYFFEDIARLAPSIASEAAALTNWQDRQL